jgi:hypothetical protein
MGKALVAIWEQSKRGWRILAILVFSQVGMDGCDPSWLLSPDPES